MHNTHPKCNAWTLFKCDGLDAGDDEKLDFGKMLAGIGRFGITYTGFQPDSQSDVERAVDFLKSSPRWLHLMRLSRFSFSRSGEEPFAAVADAWKRADIQLLTDFDGLVPRLRQAAFNLCTPPSTQESSASFLEQFGREVAAFDASLFQIACSSEVGDAARHLYEIAYGDARHHAVELSQQETQFRCDICGGRLSVECVPQFYKTEWSKRVADLLDRQGWVLSPGRCLCRDCLAKDGSLTAVVRRDKNLAAALRVAITDNSGYRGFGIALPQTIRCSSCSAEISLHSGHFPSFPEDWVLNATEAIVINGWNFSGGVFQCAACQSRGE